MSVGRLRAQIEEQNLILPNISNSFVNQTPWYPIYVYQNEVVYHCIWENLIIIKCQWCLKSNTKWINNIRKCHGLECSFAKQCKQRANSYHIIIWTLSQSVSIIKNTFLFQYNDNKFLKIKPDNNCIYYRILIYAVKLEIWTSIQCPYHV